MTEETRELPEVTVDALVVGEDLGTIEHLFTPEQVARYADFLEDRSPWFQPGASKGAVRVHPMLLANDYSNLLRHHFKTSGLVLIQTEHTYLRSIWTGQLLHTSAIVTDKGIRQGREFVEIETRTVDEEGREVARMRTTALLSAEKKVTT